MHITPKQSTLLRNTGLGVTREEEGMLLSEYSSHVDKKHSACRSLIWTLQWCTPKRPQHSSSWILNHPSGHRDRQACRAGGVFIIFVHQGVSNRSFVLLSIIVYWWLVMYVFWDIFLLSMRCGPVLFRIICVCICMCVCVCVCVCVYLCIHIPYTSRHMYECAWMHHVNHMNENDSVTSHVWICHITHMVESHTHMNTPRHTYESTKSHM